MALIQMHYRSDALWRSVPVNVILPVDKWENGVPVNHGKKFKTLYLLHGLHGDCTEWFTKTRLRRWAEANNLAVVMPAGDNSYYVDQPDAMANYGEFIGRELVEMTRAMFPLSCKREDTFIGGLSMGGFGAMVSGLKYHDTFGAILSFSGVLEFLKPDVINPKRVNMQFEEGLFGDLEKAVVSDKNPIWLAKQLAGKQNLPDIYIACGTEDYLLPHSRNFRDLLLKNGFCVTYEEGPGGHDWDFWDTYIKKALDWLPLENISRGMNSGNVK